MIRWYYQTPSTWLPHVTRWHPTFFYISTDQSPMFSPWSRSTYMHPALLWRHQQLDGSQPTESWTMKKQKSSFAVGNRTQNISISQQLTSIGGCDISMCSSIVRNLGVMTDPELSMASHINRLCQSLHYHLRNIGKIRCYLSRSSTEQLIHSLVSCHLDYGNALLYGLTD